MTTKRIMLLSPLAFALAFGAYAQGTDHSGHDMASASASAAPSTQAYIAANATMHEDMAIEYTGQADVDFIRGMIPHHQGAVEMARVVLAHGQDPEVRKLAEEIIAAQQAEIAWMTEWLEKNAR